MRADLDSLMPKTDLQFELQRIKAGLDGVMSTMVTKRDLAAFEQRMTIKFGAMVFAGMSFLAVLQKVF